MADWDYLQSSSAEKGLSEFTQMLDSGSAYGARVYFDQSPPKETASLNSRNVTYTEAMILRDSMDTPMSVQTIDTIDGRRLLGIVTGHSMRRQEGTSLYEVTVNLTLTSRIGVTPP